LTAQAGPHDPTAAQELAARQAELQQQAQDLVSQLDRMLQLLEKDYLSDYTRYEDTQTLRETLDFTQNTLMGDARRQLSPPPSQAPPSTPSPRNPQQSAPQPSGDRAPSPDQALAKQEAAQSELERMALFAGRFHDVIQQHVEKVPRALLGELRARCQPLVQGREIEWRILSHRNEVARSDEHRHLVLLDLLVLV
jgi:hypothetical protein